MSFTGFHDPFALGLVGSEERPGPILSLVRARTFDRIVLFSTPSTIDNASQTRDALLEDAPDRLVEIVDLPLTDPTNYISILPL